VIKDGSPLSLSLSLWGEGWGEGIISDSFFPLTLILSQRERRPNCVTSVSQYTFAGEAG